MEKQDDQDEDDIPRLKRPKFDHEEVKGKKDFEGDCLDKLHIGGETVFRIQGRSAQSLDWSKYGLRIHFPEDSLAPSVGMVSSDPSTPPLCSEVAIKALVGGIFQFPQGSELVSAVYAISFANKLRKPVQLEIQHCAVLKSESQFKRLSFVRAPMRQRDLPSAEFSPLEGGVFSIDSQWGSIALDSITLDLSFIAVTLDLVENIPADISFIDTEISETTSTSIEDPVVSSVQTDSNTTTVPYDSNDVSMLYWGQLYYRRVCYGYSRANQWYVWFKAAKDLNALKTYIQNEHLDDEVGPPITFGFHGNNGALELIMDQKCTCDGWTLYSYGHPLKIHQEHIDMFGREDGVPFPPSCLITIVTSYPVYPNTAQDLHFSVPIGGVVCDTEMISIDRLLEQEPSSNWHYDIGSPSPPIMTTRSRTAKNRATRSASRPIPRQARILSIEEAYDILKDASPEWEDIARELGVTDRDSIRNNQSINTPDLKLEEVLSIWLNKQKVEVWKKLIEVCDNVGHTDIAENIRRRTGIN